MFPNPRRAIQISVAPIRQHLRQARVQIQRVGCDRAIDLLAYPVAQAVVFVGGSVRPLRGCNQAVGGVIGVGENAIIEQVAVGIPGISYTPSINTAVRRIFTCSQKMTEISQPFQSKRYLLLLIGDCNIVTGQSGRAFSICPEKA